jgi:hypothetical protein
MVFRRFETRLSVTLGIPLVVFLGCYRPSIASGGFKCAPGDVCPDGFHCGPDKHCYSPGAGPPCESTPPVPSCTNAAIGGACNPICQSGCDCGWCTVASGATSCTTEPKGTKNIGDICDPAKDADCALGLFCRPECQTTTIGRCYKFCASSDDCAAPTTCNTSSPTSPISLCSLPDPNCDPVALTGCPPSQNTLACYGNGAGQACDCIGSAQQGDECAFTHQCRPGLTCVSPGAGIPATCQPVCRSNGDCTPPAICNNSAGGSNGYCL